MHVNTVTTRTSAALKEVHVSEQVTLLDSLRKRCDFVESATKQVGLGNVKVVWARAEEAGQDLQHREVDVLQPMSRQCCECSHAQSKHAAATPQQMLACKL